MTIVMMEENDENDYEEYSMFSVRTLFHKLTKLN